MKKHDRLAAHRLALTQQLETIENEGILELVQSYLNDLLFLDKAENGWSQADQIALEKGLADLDAGKGVSWEAFRKKFAQYEV